MGASRKRGPAGVPAQPNQELAHSAENSEQVSKGVRPESDGSTALSGLADMIVTVGMAFTRTDDGFGVDVFVGTDGNEKLTDAVIACEAAGELRGPVGEVIAAIAKALGGERVPGASAWLGSGSVWADDKKIGRA